MINRSVCLAASGFGILWLTSGWADGRTWTDRFGRTFEAEFVSKDGVNLVLRQPGGRTFSMAMSDLSAADLSAANGGGSNGMSVVAASNVGGSWPREVRLDGPVECKVVSEDAKAGRYIYQSPGYRFTCDARVTDDALRNFSVMFESTRKYAKSLPLGLGGRERDGKLDVYLFSTKLGYVKAGGSPNSAGCFTRGVVLVPMESLGLKQGNTGFSLDTKRDSTVLVHELAHQLTPGAYLQPGALGWFSEGLVEYMSVTPYNWGYFAPDAHGQAVKAYVTAYGEKRQGGRALGNKIQAPKLREFLLMSYREFSGAKANFNYGLGLLLTHYFFHMAGNGGTSRVSNFLKGLQAGAQGEAALIPLLGGGSYEKLEAEISAAWAREGVEIKFGG